MCIRDSDHPNAMPVDELDKAMNKFGVPTFEAIAVTGEGVFPTLKVLAGMVLESIDRMDNRRSSTPAGAPSAAAPAAVPGAAPAAAARPAAGQRGPRSAGPGGAAPRRATAPGAARPPAARPPARPAAAAAPAPATGGRKSGAMLAVGLTVFLAVAVAGVVFFVMNNK